MEKAKKCIVIIKDDFKNVLIMQKKVKRTEPKKWYLIESEIKGKATEEKAIDKIIKRSINSIIFNRTDFKDYPIEGEEGICRAYTGQLKERIVLHKDYTASKWVSQRDLEEIEMDDTHKNVLVDFFKSI